MPNNSMEWGYLNNVNAKYAKMDPEYDYSTQDKYKRSKAVNRKRINIIVLSVLTPIFLVLCGGCTYVLVESVQSALNV